MKANVQCLIINPKPNLISEPFWFKIKINLFY